MNRETSPASRLQRGAQRPVRLVNMVCQMILGLGLAVALILKVYMAVLTDHSCVADAATLGNTIRCTPTLTLLGYVLALSAGFELACRMFGSDAERVTGPIVLGLAAATLSVLGDIQSGETAWKTTVLVVLLVICMAGLAWLRRYLLPERNPDA